jgi:hypothetical protein
MSDGSIEVMAFLTFYLAISFMKQNLLRHRRIAFLSEQVLSRGNGKRPHDLVTEWRYKAGLASIIIVIYFDNRLGGKKHKVQD